jgi:hypothetical protein
MLAKLVHQGLERREELLLSCCCHSAVITTYAGRSVLSLVQQRTNGATSVVAAGFAPPGTNYASRRWWTYSTRV